MRERRDMATRRSNAQLDVTEDADPFVGFQVDPDRHNGRRVKGRGTRSNRAGRFEPYQREAVDDGWNVDFDEEELPPLRTSVQEEKSRTIITRNDSPDISFDRSINPYRGCEHGCVYCFARPTHAYMGLSAGLDFETKLFAKPEAATQLRKELSAPGYRPKAIAIGTNTDPYQPIERRYQLMPAILDVLIETGHPVGIVTKSNLILRDLDRLKALNERNLVKVALSVTSLDNTLSRRLEPRAASPQKRLEAIEKLSEAGIPTCVMVAPIIPALNDEEVEAILAAAYDAGAREAGTILLRLPNEVNALFQEWLLKHYPDRYRHVMNVLRSMRGGKDYDSRSGHRMRGNGPYADILHKRMAVACRNLGYATRRTRLALKHFKPPECEVAQLSLF
ncbi:PA0069 family radical SAM protein [Cohaesibacter sp. CAU 1516]|uniref:PA0069 family radical SAM protein n=1 Tax=Cohaesibacter sp. CAU 1516 TaxID=2576038 RepID=UPI0010FD928C|nr:PA0069 family radical SAM protein [Cohaesibacter sp. CAU 1516]TLP45531.1 PA0069 family radical SAM protein [Cohaesibacter sp. CAU 1516]